LVLAMRRRSTSKCSRQIVRRREGGCRRVNAPGEPGRDLLKQASIAVRIAERSKRAVAAMLGIRTADPDPTKQVGLVWAGMHVARIVEYLADLNAATEKLITRRRDVRDDQIQALRGAGCCARNVLAEDDRTSGAGR